MEHPTHASRSTSSRVVSSKKNAGGRPSARVETLISANCDAIAVYGDLAIEAESLLRAEQRELRHCQRLEHDMCESTCRVRALHDRILGLAADRRADNAALCRGVLA